VPTLLVTRIATIIKSITAREIFAKHKEVKKFCEEGIYGQADTMQTQ